MSVIANNILLEAHKPPYKWSDDNQMKTLPTIAEHLALHQINPIKSYGQNFIFDYSLCQKIVRTSGIDNNSNVLEIGPGSAGLTRAIASCNPKHFLAIEFDNRFMGLLNDIQHALYPNLVISRSNALDFRLEDFEETVNSKKKITKIDIVANLPYNIATELLVRWLKSINLINSITVMVQKEVALRICAPNATKEYGRISILAQALCNCTKVFDVSKDVFYPKPKVISSIIKLVPKISAYETYAKREGSYNLLTRDKMLDLLEIITHHAFKGRRKMLRNSLSEINYSIKNLGINVDIFNVMDKCDIDLKKRADSLSVEEYLSIVKLAYLYNKECEIGKK